MTMFKLETMIYASEDGTNSVFTLNPPCKSSWIPLHRSTRRCARGKQGAKRAG